MNDPELTALPARLTLISHAPTDALKRGAFPDDEPIPEQEIAKIVALAWSPPRANHVLCGPERRTQQTSAALGLEPSTIPILADVDYGAWRGKGIEDICAIDSKGFASWLRDPSVAPHGGESFMHLMTRIKQWMTEGLDAGHTVAVTHPTVVRAAIVSAMQAPPEAFGRIEISPLTITDLRRNGKMWTVRSTGCQFLRRDVTSGL